MSTTMDMMNCEEYQLAIAADPSFDGGAGHLAACAECQAYRSEMQAFERQIAVAMGIDVPTLTLPELPELDAENVVRLQQRRPMKAPTWFAIAATVLVAAFIGIRVTNVEQSYATLAEQVLAHVDHEQYALQVSDRPVSAARLARVVPANIATMNHDAGLITYAQSCEINGHDVPHLVIQGERGPITILLMPEEAISDNQVIDGESVQGFIFTVGSGSIAIIGEKDEQLQNVRQSILDSVRWSST